MDILQIGIFRGRLRASHVGWKRIDLNDFAEGGVESCLHVVENLIYICGRTGIMEKEIEEWDCLGVHALGEELSRKNSLG